MIGRLTVVRGPPLRLTWGIDEAQAAIERTTARVRRHRAALARAALAVAKMKAAMRTAAGG